MSALQIVQFEDYNEKHVQTTLFQMLQWKHGLAAELKGFAVTSDGTDSATPVYDHLLNFLSVPEDDTDFNMGTMYNYICQTMVDLHDLMYENAEKMNVDLKITPRQVYAFLNSVGYA